VLILFSPLFFKTALADKFGFGQTIFPWTLACTVWTGLAWISHNWLWCAERTRLVCVGLGVGLVISVALNLAWLPGFGLQGVVWAAAAARIGMLAVVWTICRLLHMQLDRGLFVVATLPAFLLAGPWWALGAVLISASGLVPGFAVFSRYEMRRLLHYGQTQIAKIRGIVSRSGDGLPLVPSPAGK